MTRVLNPDWLIHIPGVELGYMQCVRHGAQRFLSNSPVSLSETGHAVRTWSEWVEELFERVETELQLGEGGL